MFFFLIISLYLISFSQSAVLRCDFEDICNDFVIEYNWGLTDAQSSHLIDHDHTLNSSVGHFLFYDPHLSPQYYFAQIITKNWLEYSLNQTLCFRMWYYTPRISFPFSIELVQGDDENLVRTIASIPGKNVSINDWTLIDVKLPNEKFKIFIRTNVTVPSLAFDDISVDYCESSPPEPSDVLYACDFESSCSEDFVSLPNYSYQWLITKASEAKTIDKNAPSNDYTFQNESGHYAFLYNSDSIKAGRVGYLHLQEEFQITSNESFCLNFQYYSYGSSYKSYLAIYARMVDKPQEINLIWPRSYPTGYSYSINQWTWGITNLPMGHYTLLFAVNTDENSPHSYALDNILVISCDYPPSTFSPGYDYSLSFSCDFENSSMCEMINGDNIQAPKFNFTVFTGETLPNKSLGPFRDHTTNSTDGGFLYWNRQLPFTTNDNGRIHHPKYIEENTEMCVKFAYYVKSKAVDQNGTTLSIVTGGQSSARWWWNSLDDSQGWQLAIVPIDKDVRTDEVFFYFDVYQSIMTAVAVAFDDIEIDQCTTLIPTTTTTTSVTSTSTITTTTTTTTLSTSTVVSTTMSTSTVVTTPSTTTPNNVERLRSLSAYNLMFVLLFIYFK